MKPSDKQIAAGTLAFNECDIVSTPHCISAAYDAMTEVMTVDDVPERVRREIEAEALEHFAHQHALMNPHSWKQHIQHQIDKLRDGK